MRVPTLLIICAIQVVTPSETPPLVTLPNLGQVRGYDAHSLSGRPIFAFEGVPYARPPVGKYRFKEPKPVKAWKGVWEAKTLYKCMQYNQYTPPGQDYVIGDENCLYVNIYTPVLDQNANLDVIVYIHGGSFMFNFGGLYRPDYLLDKDVVFVTFNYRLGPLGFLSTEDDIVPGNNGMKDQILALHFIKDHIKHFGGNPDSLTLCGNSAGGVSVHFHYLSPKSRGLFQQGWSQSGTTLVPWALMEKPLDKTKKLASGVGCGTKDIKKMIDCLRTRPSRQIVASVKDFQPWLYIPFSPFGLVVDSWASDPVLPQHPYKLLEKGQVYDVPWIVSHTTSEGLYPAEEFYTEQHLDDIDGRWNELMPLILDYNYTVDPNLHEDVSKKIRQHYLGDKSVSKATFRDLLPLFSDRIFVNDIQKAASLHASSAKSPVYFYQFGYRGANSWFVHRSDDGKDFGAAHGDDAPYIFKIKSFDTRSTEDDRKMGDFLVDLVTSYAKTGKPGVPKEWPPLLKDSFTYLKIKSAEKLSIETQHADIVKFWDSLPIMENEKLFLATGKDEL